MVFHCLVTVAGDVDHTKILKIWSKVYRQKEYLISALNVTEYKTLIHLLNKPHLQWTVSVILPSPSHMFPFRVLLDVGDNLWLCTNVFSAIMPCTFVKWVDHQWFTLSLIFTYNTRGESRKSAYALSVSSVCFQGSTVKVKFKVLDICYSTA